MSVTKVNGRVAWKKAVRRGYEFAFAATRHLPMAMPLAIQSRHCGLFGDVFMAMNGLRLAEKNRLPAYVDWGRNSLYFDASHGGNVWDYFFQRSSFDFRDRDETGVIADTGRRLTFLPDAETFLPYAGLSIRRSCASAIARWCVPRPEIQDEIDAAAAQVLGPQHNLGMHIRLTDAAKGLESRTIVQLDEFVAAGHEWLEARSDGRIFLATDDAATVETMRNAFGEAVSWQDCVRSKDGQSIHGHYDAGSPGSPYQKGIDVIKDAWLLARCDHIVRTHSRVSAFSICLNPKLTFTCLEEKKFGRRSLEWLWD